MSLSRKPLKLRECWEKPEKFRQIMGSGKLGKLFIIFFSNFKIGDKKSAVMFLGFICDCAD
jgi:hypothetical protein